jgi:hypothetical protein
MDRGENDPLPATGEAHVGDRYVARHASCTQSVVDVLVLQARPGTSTQRSEHYQVDTDAPLHIHCADPDCIGGGLNVLPLVLELVDGNSDELRVTTCEGRKRLAPGMRNGSRCDTMFCVSLARRDRRTL